MPAKSKKQQRFAAMSADPKGRAKLKAKGKKPMPLDVAPDFMKLGAKHKGKRRK